MYCVLECVGVDGVQECVGVYGVQECVGMYGIQECVCVYERVCVYVRAVICRGRDLMYGFTFK